MIFICNISLHIVEYQLDAFEFIATLLQDVQRHVFLQVNSCNRNGMRTYGTPHNPVRVSGKRMKVPTSIQP